MINTDCICLNLSEQAFKSTTPLFLVHSILGDPVQDFTAFAGLIGIDFPVWGLRFNVHQQATTIETIALKYQQQIQSIQAQGPYFIGGLSAGGTIAWEIARQLTEKNERVILILLDSISPDIWRNLKGSLHTEAVYYLGFFLLPEALRTKDTILKPMREAIENGTTNKEQIKQLFEYLLCVVANSVSLKNIQVAYQILLAIYDYEPRKIPAEVHIFKASEAFISCDDRMGWCVNNSETTIIAGNHQSFLIEQQLISAITQLLIASD